MRVLHVYRTYFPDAQGGLQESIKQISLATKEFDVESKIFVLSPNPEPSNIQSLEGEIIRSKSWFAPASCDLGDLSSLLKFQQSCNWADVIHFHFPWPFADILNLLSFCKKPRVMTYHSDIVKQKKLNILYSPLRDFTIASMDVIVATSPNYISSSPILRKLPKSSKLKVIPLGIVEIKQLIIDSYEESNYLSCVQLNPNSYILFLGVLRYYKGVHTLIEAANQINSTIVIAGDGPEMQNLKSLVEAHKVKNVIFLGEVSDSEKHILLKNCCAVILPSHLRSEAFGMVLIEASLHGKPMVCCEIKSGTSFVNLHNQTGFVIEPENPDQLAQACNQLIADQSLSNKLGRASRQRYEQMFSGNALGLAYSNLYNEIKSKS
jgi:rhamnosyl/mannosyltransferase